MKKNVISITDTAAKRIKFLLEKRNKPSLGIRIGVRSGGCAGSKLYIEYADSKEKYDEIIEEKGVSILIDPKTLLSLIGSKIDYLEEKFKSEFVFDNPNAKSKCGCGKSFS